MAKNIFRNKVTIAILFLSVVLGCKVNSDKKMTSGLILTFDDRNMPNWEKQIPLFASYNAHVTFFIDHFDALTPDQITALHKLKDAGHAIGCHSLNHLRAVDFCEKNSVDKYLSDEIIPAIKMMQEKGFHPISFAYPNSNSNEETDKALLKYFRHLRSGCPVDGKIENTDRAFVRIEDIKEKGRLDGVGFHPKLKTDDLVDQAKKAIDRIQKNGEILVLYSHDIRNEGEDGPKNFVTAEALEEILSYAEKKHVKLYSFDELP